MEKQGSDSNQKSLEHQKVTKHQGRNTVSKTAKPDDGLINPKCVANASEREYK
jgi:hypothetical protein